MKALLLALLAVLATPCALAQAPGSNWPPAEFRAAVAGCRASITENAVRDYLRSRNLTESQLAPDFRSRIQPSLEPLLRTCDCSISVMSAEMSIKAFSSQPTAAQGRLRELISPGARCEFKKGS
jgi:hypothetical protein